NGKADLRAEKVKQALAVDANSAAAHWLSGEVQIGDRWMSIDDAAQQATRAGKVDEYRKQRDQRGNTLDDHIALARLAAKLGMKENERGQLMIMLQLDRKNKEAIMKLGLVTKYGLLVTPQQLESLKAANRSASASFARWTPAFHNLRMKYGNL